MTDHTDTGDGEDSKSSAWDQLLGGRELDDLVLYDVPEPHIAKITLNRPEKRNAILAPHMQHLLVERYRQAEEDDDIKVVLITGEGDHFCAGEDMRRLPVEGMGLKKGVKLGQSVRMRGATQLHHDVDRFLLYGDKTAIVACQGATVGAGFHLALGADLVVAGESAYFGRPQARIGFASFNTMLPVVLLKLGINRGYEMLVTGRTATAQQMHEWGVVSSVVPDEDLAVEGMRYAKAMTLHSTDGLMLGRKSMQMFWNSIGLANWSSYTQVAHPMFTNLVWRDEEYNFLRERNKIGHMQAMAELRQRWSELGFD